MKRSSSDSKNSRVNEKTAVINAEYDEGQHIIRDEHVRSESKTTQVDFMDVNEDIVPDCIVLVCNRFVNDNIYHAETTIHSPSSKKRFIAAIDTRKKKDACCGNSITTEDKAVGLDNDVSLKCDSGFQGMASLKTKTNRELLDLTGVTQPTFKLLLKVLSKNAVDGIKISEENRLLIVLMKLKCALTYSAIGVLFNVHRSTVSRLFISTVQYLASACKHFVTWPSRESVLATMPDSFKSSYANCRAIIDCTEIRVEQPSTVELRVQFYSHYKKGFTIKILVACTPSGLISFVSKCFGGRTTDSQITTISGFLDLLEPGDLILADKGFPQIKTLLNDSGRGVLLVMPPFLHNNTFTAEEVTDTYSTASVRIHIERIMQRLRTFKILDKFTINMLPYSDDIVFMCCVLVNLQPPIIKRE